MAGDSINYRLFFDLDYESHVKNRELLSQKIKKEIIKVIRKLHEFCIAGLPDLSMIDLDSSTQKKFSRHYIFPGIIFNSQEQMKRFVSIIADTVPSDIKQFLDMSVYAERRLFRCQGSRKNGPGKPFMGGPVFEDFDKWEKTLVCTPDQITHKVIIKEGAKQTKKRRISQRGQNSDCLDEMFRNYPPKREVNTDNDVYFYPYNRICAIAGREHRQNHIYFSYNKATTAWHQYCFSKQCQKSKNYPLFLKKKHINDVFPQKSLETTTMTLQK